jgi:UDP-N-acetyl-D-glucosamine dehydrogenase
LGGRCIPIDPFYLSWKAREFDHTTRFIELAGEINAMMPEYVINKTAEALGEHGKALKNSRILILGMSYKKNIDDMRESPSLKMMDILLRKSAGVDYSDPFIPVLPWTRKYKFNKKVCRIDRRQYKIL